MPENAENKTEAVPPPADASKVQSPPPQADQKTEQKTEKKEKTTKGMTNLILEQIRSLIEINVALNAKVKEATGQQEITERNVRTMEITVKGFDERIGKLEANMEKFIGLYEIVTNKYNPFLDSADKDNFIPTEDKVEKNNDEKIDLNKLKADAKNIVQSSRRRMGISSDGKVAAVDEVTSKLNESLQTFGGESKSSDVKATLDTFGNAKKSDVQEAEAAAAAANQPQNPQQGPAQPAAQAPQQAAANDEKELEALSSKFHFILKDGRLIRTLPELASILGDMTDDVFSHHVNNEKNDFYEWIKHSIDKDIAESIKGEKSKDGLRKKVQEHIDAVMKK